ncbi:MAG: TOBE domain-containing protein [Symbiobacterium sp.]|uniref:molybdopterin-binding protein n=1 Tax=Symbiobacterium sp. TaxID=1971213 RepID=UPI003464B511
MKLSTRNQLKGTVKAVEIDGVMAKVTLDVTGQTMTAVITADSARDLELKPGDSVAALIKATSVSIMK